jgi:predicted MPP superfamily phosphohydrolase
MVEVKIAVVSDLHCHPSSVSPADSFLLSDGLRSPSKFHPIESLLNLISEKGISTDILLAAGDFTNKINQQGLVSGWSYVKELQKALSAQAIVATVGNHDVDSRKTVNFDPFLLPRNFSPADFPCASETQRNKFWLDGFFIHETDVLRVVVVNSVLSHQNEDEAKRGAIKESHLEILERALELSDAKSFNIALVHHHPIPHENLGLGYEDLMVNGSQLIDLLERFKFQIAIHGHKHYPRLRYSSGGASSPAVFAAGSLSAFSPQMLSNTRNLFHIIALDDSYVEDCVGQGVIRSWEYNSGKGWSLPKKRSADFPAVAGFGCRASHRDLARRTSECLEIKLGEYRKWSEVLSHLPQIAFLLPSDLEAYGLELKKNFGLVTHPDIGDLPEIIGKPEV